MKLLNGMGRGIHTVFHAARSGLCSHNPFFSCVNLQMKDGMRYIMELSGSRRFLFCARK